MAISSPHDGHNAGGGSSGIIGSLVVLLSVMLIFHRSQQFIGLGATTAALISRYRLAIDAVIHAAGIAILAYAYAWYGRPGCR